METCEGFADRRDAIIALFVRSFGATEGPTIGDLVAALMAAEGDDAPTVLRIEDVDAPIAAVFLTPVRFGNDAGRAALLSPVGVDPARHGEGIGTRLVARALRLMAERGAELVMTYGDPAFYGRTGFVPVTTGVVPAPFPLTQPQGWQAWTADGSVTPRAGPVRCVPAFERPELW